MVLLRDIKGQDNAVRYLSKSLSSGRIANSFLFFGPQGVGRATCAKAFITALVCREKAQEGCAGCPACRKVDSLEHPDVHWLRPENSRTIKIQEVRRIKDALNLKPYEAPISVCVIEDAHLMTREASNALLKVLEEPPGHSKLILITDKKELLLETVVSRCAEVRFRYLSMEVTRDIILSGSDCDAAEARFLAYYSQGSPGRALEMAAEGVVERRNELLDMVEGIMNERNPTCLNWDTEDRAVLLEDLEMMIVFLRDVVMGKAGLDDMVLNADISGDRMCQFFEKYPVDKICGVVERLINVKVALSGNVNPKLVAQTLPGALK